MLIYVTIFSFLAIFTKVLEEKAVIPYNYYFNREGYIF